MAFVVVASACTPFTAGEADAGSPGDGAVGSSDSGGAPLEAGADSAAPGVCPASVCSSCAGGVCTIECPGTKCPARVQCPPGLPCRVACTGVAGCKSTDIDCTRATSCTVACSGGVDTCDEVTIQSGTAPLCMSCEGSKAACDAVTCKSAAACTRACVGDACVAGKTCPECAPAAACP